MKLSRRDRAKMLMRLRMESKRKGRFIRLAAYEDQEYIRITQDILQHPVFRKMQSYTQHGETSCQEHCLMVSYRSYCVAKAWHWDYVTCARAGLLHDLFLYDWHEHYARTGDFFHGLTHPRTALTYASHHFSLTEQEMDAILKHMWPITIIPPRYREGYLVSTMDKVSTSGEVVMKSFQKLWGR